jgi:hypothetical protein
LFLGLTGCGSNTAEVSGTVTYEGRPVPSGSVVLYCADGQIVRGNVRDGQYSIPNVPRGAARVVVQSPQRVPPGLRLAQQLPPAHDGPIPPTAAGADTEPVVALPRRYSVPEESGLTMTVDGRAQTFDIHLTR